MRGVAYDTNFGRVVFINNYSGFHHDGMIIGSLQGNIFGGEWDSPEGNATCVAESVLGSKRWGQILFKFTDNLESFTGTRDNCGSSLLCLGTGTAFALNTKLH